MRLIFAGTPDVAVPSLRVLAASDHDIATVVTRPDAPIGRRRVLTPSPVAAAAEELGLPLLKTARLDEGATARLATTDAELGVIVAYGGLVREPLLSMPEHGWINLHFSLLPRWRGAAPVQHALIAGDDETGASVFRLVAELDAGDVFEERRYAVPARATAGEVLNDLAGLGAELLRDVVAAIEDGTAVATPQAGAATFAPKLTEADGALDWNEPADRVAGSHPRRHTGTRRTHHRRGDPHQAARCPGARGRGAAQAGRDRGPWPRHPDRHGDAVDLRLEGAAGRQAGDVIRRLVARSAQQPSAGGDMSAVQPARRVAYETLRAVHESDAYANLLLPRAIARAGLSTQDAALATELTYGTLRRQGTYDAIITEASSRNVHEIDPPVLDALRLAVHQLLHTRVASHAAVNESVSLAREAVGNSASGFTNAVLRRVARETPGEWMSRIDAAARSDDERLGLHTAHPVWIVRAFRRALAAEGRADELDALLAADNVSPGVTMAALPGLSEPPEGAQPTPYSPIGFRLGGGDPDPVVRASEGRVRVQDEGSQLAALALTRRRRSARASGGSTCAPAPAARRPCSRPKPWPAARSSKPTRSCRPAPGWCARPSPAFRSTSRSRRRTAAIAPAARSAATTASSSTRPVPGLGALRRRPEARWRKTPSDVPDLARLQAGLVDAALKALAPGGILAYVTCSPHLAETSAVVADARRAWGDRIEELDARAVLEGLSESPLDLPAPADGSGRAQLWPHRHGTDAMFISLLRRV